MVLLSRASLGGVIADVYPESIAHELGLAPGDAIVAIDGQPLRDLVDYKTRMAVESAVVTVRRRDGEALEIELQKDPDEDLGVSFETVAFDGLLRCRNHCLFCFVDQMAAGLRSSLYVKDDDYRLSFCQGSYITLTNLSEEEIRRIVDLRLGPLYISVHATDPEVRRRMLGNPHAGEIMTLLRRLAAARIQLHAQIVLCPGINDGPVLDRTLTDLAELHPWVASVAVVPVGLSAHRDRLPAITPFTESLAKGVVDLVTARQAEFHARFRTRLAFLADEFYWLANAEIPRSEAYEDFGQLEDGVGLTRQLWDETAASLDSADYPWQSAEGRTSRRYLLITGLAGARVLQPLAFRLASLGLEVVVLPVTNNLLGHGITVAGLLGGRDAAAAARDFLALDRRTTGRSRAWHILLPDVMFRTGGGRTLDDLNPSEISSLAGASVEVLGASGEALIDRLLRSQEGERQCKCLW